MKFPVGLFVVLGFAITAFLIYAHVLGSGNVASTAGNVSRQDQTLSFVKTPSFVTEYDFVESEQSIFDPVEGVSHLLIDAQLNNTAEVPENYMRVVKKISSQAGLGVGSQIILVFDPSYQQLNLTHVDIIRDGRRSKWNKKLSIDVVRQSGLFYHDALQAYESAIVVLDGLKVGDIIDYGYVVSGKQSDFGGRFAVNIITDFGVPAERYTFRALWRGRVNFKKVGLAANIKRSSKNGVSVLEIPAQPLDTIAGKDPFFYSNADSAYFTLSDFGAWSDIGAWGEKLFQIGRSSAVAEIAQRIEANNKTVDEQIIAALRYVQEEIKYVAPKFGEGGYTPLPVEAAISEGVGDCKAKTLLFISLLNELGVEATPALVNTVNGLYLRDKIPSPTLFDHVIVGVPHQGDTLWLDPTIINQGGDLDNIAGVDFGFALPLTRRTHVLKKMSSFEPTPEPEIIAHEVIDLSDGAYAPGSLKATMTIRNRSADTFRSILNEIGEEYAKRHLYGVYAHFGSFEISNFEVNDDREKNIIQFSYNVTMDQPFYSEPERNRRTFTFSAHSITPILPDFGKATPADELIYTQHYSTIQHEITVKLTKTIPWDFSNYRTGIRNSAFSYEEEMRFAENTLTINRKLIPQKKYIQNDMYEPIFAEQKEMQNRLIYNIWAPLDKELEEQKSLVRHPSYVDVKDTIDMSAMRRESPH